MSGITLSYRQVGTHGPGSPIALGVKNYSLTQPGTRHMRWGGQFPSSSRALARQLPYISANSQLPVLCEAGPVSRCLYLLR